MHVKDTSHHQHYPINLILSNIPYQGGGDYRGIYDIGFKRGFMGYIGLLLNAPYKIDSMVWMRCGLCSLSFCEFFMLAHLYGLYKLEWYFG
jgi:hypothetical protein